MTTWRVATYNIRHGLGEDGRVDLARTAAEIAALEADVVGLQEVDVAFGPRSGHEDQAARLGELLGMQVTVGAAIDREPARPGEVRRRYGVALLTRHELVAPEMHLLPEHPGGAPVWEPRGVLVARVRRSAGPDAMREADGAAQGGAADGAARVEGPGGPAGGSDATRPGATGQELTVLVTHLDSQQRQHRTAEVQGIVRLVDDLPDAAPAVLMGDMNAAPTAPELGALTATGWREAAQELERTGGAVRRPWSRRRARKGRRPWTGRKLWTRRLGAATPALGTVLPALAGAGRATHPARFPVRRIDALWVRGPVEVDALTVGARGASDHRPVLAALRTS